MKMLGIIAIMQLAGGWALYPPQSDAQQIDDEPSAAVRACITTNAPGVERAIESLNEGSDFLIQKICAGPITEQVSKQQAEQGRKMADAQKARMQAVCDKRDEAPKPAEGQFDPNAYLYAMCATSEMNFGSDAGLEPYNSYFYGPVNAPQATSLAAQTLLKLRVDRLNKKP